VLTAHDALHRQRRQAVPDSTARRSARTAGRIGIAITATAALSLGGIPAANAVTPVTPSTIVDADDAALQFDGAAYSTITVTIDGAHTTVRVYKEICYVADPVAVKTTQSNPGCGYQSMNVYVPESTVGDQDAAIYFAVNNSGWMASYIKNQIADGTSYSSATSNVGAALKAGFVYIDVASRSRGITSPDGTSYVGKAPAPIVDAKAAVRYLRLNDAAMPGSAERIVVNGTSGGGGQSTAMGASGNSPDYYPYLEEIGAAGFDAAGRSTLRDDVFAINAYCPITDLGNADILYDWLYNALGTRATVGPMNNATASAALAAAYPAYQASLGLTNPDGTPLTADNMIETVKSEVIRSAEAYMAADPANVVPDLGAPIVISGRGGDATFTNDWIDVDNDANTVVSVDMTNYLNFVAMQNMLKPAPSFDQSGATVPGSGGGPGTGESSLFGTSSQEYSNFTEYSWNHNDIAGDGSGLDDTGLTWAEFIASPDTVVDEQIDLIDPLHYLGTSADAAPYWYVRTGTRDRDTAFTVSINLDRALQADPDVVDANYRLAWNQPHAGNYDVPEAFAWIQGVLAEADAGDAGGIGVEATVPEDAQGVLALTIADYGDHVTLDKASNGGDRLRFTGTLPKVTVSDSRNAAQAAGGGWAVSGQASAFASRAAKLSAEHFGWTPQVLSARTGLTAGGAVATSLDGGPGLAQPATLATATSAGRLGSADLGAGLVLDAPVDTPAGTYRGTLTVSLFPVD
jgi:hypothetical protein